MKALASLALVFTLASSTFAPCAQAQHPDDSLSSEQAREENAYAVGLQAYLWGFPLQFYGQLMPASEKADVGRLDDFHKYSALKTAKDRHIVTPNNVTIDAYGDFDVSAEPLVIFVPTLAEARWYIVQIGDTFDEVIRNVGGIKGPQPGVYLITGPDYIGTVPGEMTQVKSRTKLGVVAVRILANGAEDLPKAVEAQKGFVSMPLSAYLRNGLAYKRPAERPMIETYESRAPEEIRYFDDLGYWLSKMLPVSADSNDSLLASFHQIGLSVGKGFEWQMLDEPTKRGLVRAAKVAPQIIDSKWAAAGETANGWMYTFAGGRAGYDPGLRAALTKYEVGAQLSNEVLYPNTSVDDRSEALTGARKYLLHFEADKLPPVSVFWNLAMYADDMLFVENDFGRYSIGSTTDGLKSNPDGSLTITIQKDRPADTSNWLPAPDGPFNLTMRLYGPGTSVLDGSYRLPAVKLIR